MYRQVHVKGNIHSSDAQQTIVGSQSQAGNRANSFPYNTDSIHTDVRNECHFIGVMTPDIYRVS